MACHKLCVVMLYQGHCHSYDHASGVYGKAHSVDIRLKYLIYRNSRLLSMHTSGKM